MGISTIERQNIVNDAISRLTSDGLYVLSLQNQIRYFRNTIPVPVSVSPFLTSGTNTALEVMIDDIIGSLTDYYGTSGTGISALSFTTENGISATGNKIGINFNPSNLQINSIGQLDLKNPSSTGITNHSLLTNLDSDDHLQYITNQPSTDLRNFIIGTSDFTLLSLKSYFGQTKNIFNIFDSSSNALFSVSANGDINASGNIYLIGLSGVGDRNVVVGSNGKLKATTVSGSGGSSGSGTIGTISKFVTSTTLGDSLISESGSIVSVNGKLIINNDVIFNGVSKNLIFSDASTHIISGASSLNVYAASDLTLRTDTNNIILSPSKIQTVIIANNIVSAAGNLRLDQTSLRLGYLAGNSNRLLQTDSVGNIQSTSLSASQVVMVMDSSSQVSNGTQDYFPVYTQSRGIANSNVRAVSYGTILEQTLGSELDLTVSNLSTTAAASRVNVYTQGGDSSSYADIRFSISNLIVWSVGTDYTTSAFSIGQGSSYGNFSTNRYFTINKFGLVKLTNGLTVFGSFIATGTLNINSLSGTTTRQLGVDTLGNVIIVGSVSASVNGTPGKIAKFISGISVGDSLISESGSMITITGSQTITSTLNVSGAIAGDGTLKIKGQSTLNGTVGIGDDLFLTGSSKNLVFTDVSTHIISGAAPLNIYAGSDLTLQTDTNNIIFRPNKTTVLTLTQFSASFSYLAGNSNRLVQASSTGVLVDSGLSASYVVMSMDSSSNVVNGTQDFFPLFSQSRGIKNSNVRAVSYGTILEQTLSSELDLSLSNLSTSTAASRVGVYTQGADSSSYADIRFSISNLIVWSVGTDYTTSAFSIGQGSSYGVFATNKSFIANKDGTVNIPGHTTLGSLSTSTSIGLLLTFNRFSGGTQFGIYNSPAFTSAASTLIGLSTYNTTAPNAHSVDNYTLYVGDPLVTANSTVLNNYGIFVEPVIAGTLNYGLYISDLASSNVNNYAIKTGIGYVSFGDKVFFPAASASKSSINIAPGVATSTNDGDLWYTGTQLRFNSGGSIKIITWT